MRLVKTITALLLICCSISANAITKGSGRNSASADSHGSVQVSASYLAFPKSEIDELIKKEITKPLDVSDLSALLAKGKGRVVANPCLIVQDRNEAVLLDQNSIRIPQDVDVEFAIYRPTNNTHSAAAVAKPQDFEDIGIGLSFTAVTIIAEDRKTIQIHVNSEFIDEIEITERKISVVHSEDGASSLSVEKAAINRHSVSICTEVQDGESIVLAGGSINKNDEMVYIILTCKIMSFPQAAPK